MTKREYTGCIFAFMFGEWAVLMEHVPGDEWVLPSGSCDPLKDVRGELQGLMADCFGMCIPATDFSRSRAVSGWMTAFVDPTGKDDGPEVIFDELCITKLRWLPVSRLHRFANPETAELVKAELRAQGFWRNLYHIIKSKIKKPVL